MNAENGLGLHSWKFQFSVAVYNKVWNDHKLLSETIEEISDIQVKLKKLTARKLMQ
jgi:hypothetical protein